MRRATRRPPIFSAQRQVGGCGTQEGLAAGLDKGDLRRFTGASSKRVICHASAATGFYGGVFFSQPARRSKSKGSFDVALKRPFYQRPIRGCHDETGRLTTLVLRAGNHLTLPSLTKNLEKFCMVSARSNLRLRAYGQLGLTQSMSLTWGSACSFRYFQIGCVSGPFTSAY